MNLKVRPGRPLPLGAYIDGHLARFAVFSRHATKIWLLFFEDPQATTPVHRIALEPLLHRTGDIWHVEIEGLRPGIFYGYSVDGPYVPAAGRRFNKNKLLVDPFAKAITGNFTWELADARGYDIHSPQKDLSFSVNDDVSGTPKCILLNDDFDWQGDRPLNYPLKECIIYETHVRSLTNHASAGVHQPGTFQGVLEKIDHFKKLGVTSLEFLPVMEFDENEVIRHNPLTGAKLQNFWGYSTICFMAPKGRYSSSGFLGQQVTEFKTMVRELHRAGLEVIVDIV
ncbi:glycogen debranching enzyme, partial [candidate division KSB1 bacterium]|nr:glycogen debranching enzyme [candidate division KSB1 bacterium]